MDAGGLAQMSHTPSFGPAGNMQLPTSGLASRRGGQGIKPLSFDALKSPGAVEPAAPTPRTTARSHLLANLRTAPKSATAATFAASGTVGQPSQARNRNSVAGGFGNDDFNGPKTSLPRGYTQNQEQVLQMRQQIQQAQAQQHAQQQAQQQAQQAQQLAAQHQAQRQMLQQQQAYGGMAGYGQAQQTQYYTPDQILAPPEINLEDQAQESMDPTIYANLVSTNMYLAQQQQRLQQQLLTLQAAQQQVQGMNLGNNAYQNVYQQQQQQLQQQQLQQQMQQLQLKSMQQQMMGQGMQTPQGTVYTVYDPVTGQSQLYLDAHVTAQQHQQQQQQQWMAEQYGYQAQTPVQNQQSIVTPRVQVSPPPAESRANGFRNPSPPRRYESPEQAPTPLPPPSANAFRRGHKKSSSVTNGASLSIANSSDAGPKSPGPKTAGFPLTPLTGGYGPGQARAGEHPVRQPRGPPSFDELRTAPTSKHEGSKNFAGRTRRSALSNLVRAGITRRQATTSNGSSGSISPISETAEEQLVATPLTEDDESVSGRSGSGSLNGDDVECSLPSSRTSTGSWGAIGSDRPSSRQKTRKSVDSLSNASGDEGTGGSSSFASVFKSAGKSQTPEAAGQRKAPMLVLNRAEKRKTETPAS